MIAIALTGSAATDQRRKIVRIPTDDLIVVLYRLVKVLDTSVQPRPGLVET